MPLRLISDFDLDSRDGAKCSVNGTIKRPEDPGVFRGPLIEMEGYFDICVDVIREAADQLGLVDEVTYQTVVAERDDLERALLASEERIADLTARCHHLILMNAELLDSYVSEDDE